MRAAGALSLLLATACAGQAPPTPAPSCRAPLTFADGKTPATIRHVATTGDDARGDGSATLPYRSIARAARSLAPGTAIQVHAGSYAGGIALANLHGTADAPIWIVGAPGEERPIVQGGTQGIYLQRPRYVVLRHLEIAGTADNGINVDDGDEMANEDAARFIVFDDLDIHETGRRPSGVPDCLKLAGVNDFVIMNSRFADCGTAEHGAVGVNGVGAHRGHVFGNRFLDTGYGGVQFKGASADVEIVGNEFQNAGWRGVNMGGSTGGPFFRPPVSASATNYEAARLHVVGNSFAGGETAAAFTGCVECAFTGNRVTNPSRWALRILQETTSIGGASFAPASRGTIADNLFYFRRADLNAGEDINVGANTDTASFALSGNAWVAHDDPAASAPRLPLFRGSQAGETSGAAVDVSAFTPSCKT